ncbi:hypothetical protein RGF90_001721 [Acinetobacter baumannii]|nr:hypothetical protein [Acinetobacter baumannii]ELA6841206.1 hypothetical protein [Acinetobacter baumannii]ELA6861401.1 hypothetical protein [Acinetobacter baumannii]
MSSKQLSLDRYVSSQREYCLCWADAPDVTPEQDYMTIDEDLNSVWANYHNDPPSHWMHFHSVPNVSGAEQ